MTDTKANALHISKLTYEKLMEIREKDEDFEHVIARLIDGYERWLSVKEKIIDPIIALALS
jgi:hypothetical protein